MNFLEILIVLTVITGVVYLIDYLFLNKKRGKYEKESFIVEQSKSFFPVLLLVVFIRSFVAENFKIPTGSMKPSFLEGDFILVNRYEYGIRTPIIYKELYKWNTPKRGDVVIFYHPDKDLNMIKRVVGVPGDKISFKNDYLYVNDKIVEQDLVVQEYDYRLSGEKVAVFKQNEHIEGQPHHLYLPVYRDKSIESKYNFNDVIVPENKYFVCGDNRYYSDDSRYWGFLDEKYLMGKAAFIWMSWDSRADSWLNKIRWNRLFTMVHK